MNKKANLGQYNTKDSVWLKPQVEEFIINSKKTLAIDPFAGEGDLLYAAKRLGIKRAIGFDIDGSLGWKENDSLKEIPYYDDTIIITNPPYLAKNSAKRQHFDSYKYFYQHDYLEDLYQLAMIKVLSQYDKAVFIIPETYILTDLYKDALYNVTILEDNPFDDTDCPVCVACFSVKNDFFRPYDRNHYFIYKNEKLLFSNRELDEKINLLLNTHSDFDWRFNDIDGPIGLRGVDGVDPQDKIRFCKVEELDYDLAKVKISSRAITTINIYYDGDFDSDLIIKRANEILKELRTITHDVIFAPFKNNNKNGQRRRRLDFGIARKILNKVFTDLTNEKQ